MGLNILTLPLYTSVCSGCISAVLWKCYSVYTNDSCHETARMLNEVVLTYFFFFSISCSRIWITDDKNNVDETTIRETFLS
jgi:hypothetical protein